MPTRARGEEEYVTLMRRLSAFRDRLPNRPSYRALAEAAGVASPTTIQAWLRGERFPQQIDQVLNLVERIRAAAPAREIDEQDLGGLLDESRWRDAYRIEAAGRAEKVADATRAAHARDALSRDPGLADSYDNDAVRQPKARLRAVLPVPYPPNEFVERPDVERQALNLLLQPPPSGRGRVIALAGMSGAGKTVLAQAIASDETVRRTALYFADFRTRVSGFSR